MTSNVSRRSLLALGAGLGATTLLGDSALARAPKLGTQSPYWHRFILGDAEVTVVSDGPLPLGWRAPLQGPVHPKFVNVCEKGGIGWLAGFDEWLCRCGLAYNGPPGEDVVRGATGAPMSIPLTLHGKIGNLPARRVDVTLRRGDPPVITVRGVVDGGLLRTVLEQLSRC